MVARLIIGGLIAVSITLPTMPVHADATLKVQDSDGLKSTIQVRNARSRMSSEGKADYLLFDSLTGTITFVEPEQQQYTQLTAAELEATVQTAANIKQSMAPFMASMLAGLPAEQRKMIEQRMGAMPDAPAAGGPEKTVDIRTVNRGRHIFAGLPCQSTEIIKNGRPAAEICMATTAGGQLSDRDFTALEALIIFSRGLAGTASGLLGGMTEQLELLAVDLDGVPVAVHDIEHGKRYQVTAVSNAALSDVLFNSYGKFQKQKMPNLFR